MATRRQPQRPRLAILGSLLDVDDRTVDSRGDPHRAGPGRGRLLPRPAGVPARPPRDLRRARDPAHRRRGPVRLRPDREMWAFEHAEIVPDVVVVAKAIANGLPLSAIAPAASCRSAGAGAPTARRTAAIPWRARPGSRSSRRSRTRASSRTPGRAARSCPAGLPPDGRGRADRRRPRTRPDDRRRVRPRPGDARARRRPRDRARGPLRRAGLLVLKLRRRTTRSSAGSRRST